MASSKKARRVEGGVQPITGYTMSELRELPKPTADIKVYLAPELKEVAFDHAAKAGVCLSEWIVQLMAHAVDRPDLAKVPRKPMGRRPKHMSAVPA